MKKLALIIMAACFVLAACKKDDKNSNGGNGNPDNPDPGTTSGLVSQIINYEETVNDYKYDSQNRLISITQDNEPYATFTYVSANKIEARLGDDNFILTLNSDGYITNLQSDYGYSVVYEYENGYLKKETDETGVTSIYFWENGNLIKEQTTFPGIGTNTYTYSYGTAPYKETNIAIWAPPMSEFFFDIPVTFFGKRSKNLATSMVGRNESEYYRYVTNAEGYVTKVYLKEGDSAEKLWLEVKYK